jgi:hypothetical protein
MKLVIEQIALCPPDPARARALLAKLGLTDWIEDTVTAEGVVRGNSTINQATLAFNYQAQPRQLELEVLHYLQGDNWMARYSPSASHLGMHCTAAELIEWRKLFANEGIKIAQEVETQSHTNPAIAGLRRYRYVIFETRPILGVDIKLIVRLYDDDH